MRGVVIFFGLLLLLAGGAVAAAQYVPVDLSSYLASMPGAEEFLKSQMALYAGGGAAGLGLLLMIIGMATGGSKKTPKEAPKEAKPAPAPRKAAEAKETAPRPAPAPAPAPQSRPAAAAPQPRPAPQLQPVAAAPRPAAPAAPTGQAKPQASSQPPPATDPGPTWTQDPRLLNRKRVSDIVSLNDAIKAYHKKHGAYPKADGLKGYLERGKSWIPGLAPEFIAELPRDPARSDDAAGPQYVYSSNGADYKLLAHGVALAGGTNVEVLGVRIDASRNPTWEKASFGFWTEGYASV
ncbi:MAG TPA: hypothetical protein VIA80_12370 [Hyphomonadaceae bacterium]